MESRTKVLASLASLVAISGIAATVGTYRIAVLASDLSELLEFDLPLERGAASLSLLVSHRTGALESPVRVSGRESSAGTHTLSEQVSIELDALESLLAENRSSDAGLANLRRTVEAVKRKESEFRFAKEESGSTVELLRRSRAVEGAVVELIGSSTDLTDRVAARTTTDERTSLTLLAGLALSGLVLGALVARYALRIFSEMQTLRVLVPVCSDCMQVRNDPPFWRLVDTYLEDTGHTKLAHGRCPECEAARAGRTQTA